ncbi:MAG: lysophospholipid acyltransferase family protein [Bacteroidetes bacterium]|nr:lysophospholipid acyltransferase family protein [Bacteroidota bacterium]
MIFLSRFITFWAHTFIYLIIGVVLHIFLFPTSATSKRKYISIVSQSWAMGICWIMNIKLKVEGKNNINPDEAYLIVSNHLSYFDVCLIGSIIPTQFVGKREVIRWPIFGWLALIGGVIFIDRSKITHGVSRAKIVAKSLIDGNSVSFFPEGTTTLGDKLLPFKPSFFLAAVESKKSVLPITINYGKINGEPITTHSQMGYYGWQSKSFLHHGFRLMTVKSLEMILKIHKPIQINDGEDARTIMKKSEQVVLSGLKKVS